MFNIWGTATAYRRSIPVVGISLSGHQEKDKTQWDTNRQADPLMSNSASEITFSQ